MPLTIENTGTPIFDEIAAKWREEHGDDLFVVHVPENAPTTALLDTHVFPVFKTFKTADSSFPWEYLVKNDEQLETIVAEAQIQTEKRIVAEQYAEMTEPLPGLTDAELAKELDRQKSAMTAKAAARKPAKKAPAKKAAVKKVAAKK